MWSVDFNFNQHFFRTCEPTPCRRAVRTSRLLCKQSLCVMMGNVRDVQKYYLLKIYCNKTTEYHRHILRRPILLKMLFKRMKAFLFQKNSLHIFFNFSEVENSDFFVRKFTTKVKNTFLRNNIVFATFNDFEKCQALFEETHLFRRNIIIRLEKVIK